VYYNFVIM